ncbi:SGF29 tudor-like domain-containing protein [Ephemerocybe angulata]|nr:SGF29 tudor-like domain-containing protein [Tulosesus angulatus]
MDRRRGMPARPSSEEDECWTHAAVTLRELSAQLSGHPPIELIGKANRLYTTWPSGDDMPGEGWKSLKENYKKLTNALEDIQRNADAEAKLFDKSIEQLTVLMALRKANETSPSDKRNKRPRASSPSGTPGPGAANARGVSITLPPRTNSVGPSAHSKKKDGRAHPLQPGRRIAFWNGAAPNRGTDDADWILAIVIKVVSQRDGRYTYEVRDAEEQDGTESVVAPQKHVIPLPDPKSPITPEFPIGSTVLGLYPDTSCFYRAEVVATPKSLQSAAGRQPIYKLKFEDDDNQEHPVPAEWVVEFPNLPSHK